MGYIELRKCRIQIQTYREGSIINVDDVVGISLENTSNSNMAVSYEGETSSIDLLPGDIVKLELPALFCLSGKMEVRGEGAIKAYIYKAI